MTNGAGLCPPGLRKAPLLALHMVHPSSTFGKKASPVPGARAARKAVKQTVLYGRPGLSKVPTEEPSMFPVVITSKQ